MISWCVLYNNCGPEKVHGVFSFYLLLYQHVCFFCLEYERQIYIFPVIMQYYY